MNQRYKKLLFVGLALAVILFVALYSWKRMQNSNANYPVSINYDDTQLKSSYNIVIGPTSNEFLGDTEQAKRLAIAAKNLGWKVHVVASLFDDAAIQEVIALKPDFTISMIPNITPKFSLPFPNYAILSYGTDYYLRNNWYHLKPVPRTAMKQSLLFDGILLTDNSLARFAKFFAENKKPFYGVLYYPTAQALDNIDLSTYRYQDPKIFFSGANWDNKRGGRLKDLYKKLEQAGYTDFYGPAKSWKMVGPSYKGFIPIDGISFLNTMQKYAVALVFHSPIYNKNSIPSGRIFEASAAGNIIISDRNGFVIKHFGDSVLYIDADSSNDEIFKQIDNHMQWIRNNPEKAKAMAEKAHNILLEKLTAEQCLLKIAHMHEAVMRDRAVKGGN